MHGRVLVMMGAARSCVGLRALGVFLGLKASGMGPGSLQGKLDFKLAPSQGVSKKSGP